MKFSVKDFFSKCFFSFLRIWSHLLKKSLMENFISCAVILGFQLAQFSSLLLCVKMMLNFEFCCYFYLVLVELFRQGIWIFHMLVFLWLTGHNGSHGTVLLPFMSFYCTIQSRWYRI